MYYVCNNIIIKSLVRYTKCERFFKLFTPNMYTAARSDRVYTRFFKIKLCVKMWIPNVWMKIYIIHEFVCLMENYNHFNFLISGLMFVL